MRLVVLVAACLLVCGSGYANIVNGGFETGNLTGWSAGGTFNNGNGNVQILMSGDFAANDGSISVAAPEGIFYALLSNGPGDQGGSPLDASTLTSIPYLVGAGANISFFLEFFTNEFPTPNGDFYNVTLLESGVPVATITSGDVNSAQTAFPGIDCISVFLVAPDGTSVCTRSGLDQSSVNNFGLSAYAGSVVQFQFLVSDAFDNNVDSALLVDGVRGTGLTDASTVPEPASWVLLLSAASVFWLLRIGDLRRGRLTLGR